MANLVNGKISDEPIAKLSRKGEFERPQAGFRGKISKEHAVADRFHLYVSYACPWAHRTLITRNLKGLQETVSVSVSEPFMGEKGWTFNRPQDPKYLALIYLAQDKKYTGKVSVPVLWDQETKEIVNNESSEIIRILNNRFDHLTHSEIDLYPDALKEKIDSINSLVYEDVNNGVYKAGFASHQDSYEKACQKLFYRLDELDNILSTNPFLTGQYFTEADIRLFTTLIRFDVVYYGHFKCNIKRILDYPHLYQYMKSIFQVPEIKETCHFDHIKTHYYQSHGWINPTRIIPLGPKLDLDSPHDRGEVRFYKKNQLQH